MALIGTLSRFLGLSRSITLAEQGVAWEWEDRRVDYAMWESAYANTIYDLQANGGFREVVLKYHLGIDCTPASTDVPLLIGYYNPVKQIVDVYQNMLPGQYGVDISVAEKVDGKPVNPVLIDPQKDPLGLLWRQSNLDTTKQVLQRWGANLGTVGMRVVGRTADQPQDRRVTVQFDHPSRIVDYAVDDRGNATRVRLEYIQTIGFAKEARDVEVVEEYDEESFSITYDDAQQLEPEQRVNPLGFCPYVVYRFDDDGKGGFGRPCHDGTQVIIDAINWALTNQGESIYEHEWPQWFLTASGPAPVQVNMGKGKVWYVPTVAGGVPPSAEAIVPQIDYASVSEFIDKRKAEVRERQPETALGSLETVSGLSGESYAKLLLSTEQKVMAARTNLQHALKRAAQMAFSYQILYGMTDFGTGTGSRESADRAFDAGKLDFEFAPAPVLPLTAADKSLQIDVETKRRGIDLANASTLQRLGLPDDEVLKEAGYTDEEIATIKIMKATEGVVPTEQDDL